MNVLVTGGASGIGEAITRLFSKQQNMQVYFTFNSSSQKAKELTTTFSNVHAIKCNFSSTEDVQSLIDQIHGWNIDLLINNAYAGEFLKTHFHKIDSAEFSKDFNNTVIPTIRITQAAIDAFRKKKSGKIITILTTALNDPPVGSSVYVATKAYLEKLTKIWALENVKYNITSNSVSPSFLQTNFTKNIDERIVEQIKENSPLKKLLTVEEVAEKVLFLANASSEINGIDITLGTEENDK